MKILCIDPGTEESGFVILDSVSKTVESSCSNSRNEHLINMIKIWNCNCDKLAIEGMNGSYGTAVGSDVIQTLIWTGRFIQAFGPHKSHIVYRSDVKKYLADNNKANDAAIRQALIDRYPKTGGGKIAQIGIKSKPGPLYGIANHAWAALAVGHTYIDTRIN